MTHCYLFVCTLKFSPITKEYGLCRPHYYGGNYFKGNFCLFGRQHAQVKVNGKAQQINDLCMHKESFWHSPGIYTSLWNNRVLGLPSTLEMVSFPWGACTWPWRVLAIAWRHLRDAYRAVSKRRTSGLSGHQFTEREGSHPQTWVY